MKTNDDFYIGWQNAAPTSIARIIKRFIVGIGLAGFVCAIVLALAQHTIAVSVFEWGKIKDFSGVFRSNPYPHLLVSAPDGSQSSYYLVKPFKFGIDPMVARKFDGKLVNLKGTLIYRGDQRMIEAIEDSIQATNSVNPVRSNGSAIRLGRQTLVGEIVDSKCYFGVMNPGNGKVHRDCAVRCISGGIPPSFLVRDAGGRAVTLLLARWKHELLDHIAEPVTIRGHLVRTGGRLTLYAE